MSDLDHEWCRCKDLSERHHREIALEERLAGFGAFHGSPGNHRCYARNSVWMVCPVTVFMGDSASSCPLAYVWRACPVHGRVLIWPDQVLLARRSTQS